jgi:hypothetical protein
MKDLLIQMYRILSQLMVQVANFSVKSSNTNHTVFWTITAGLVLVSFALLIIIVRKAGGRPKWTYILIGALPICIIIHCAVLKLNQEDLFQKAFYQNWIVLLLPIIAIVFLIVNFILEKSEGILILLLWITEYLLGCITVRIWAMGWTGSTYRFSKLLWVQELIPVFNEDFLNSKFPSFNYSIICIIFLIILCIGNELFISYSCKWLEKSRSIFGVRGLFLSQLLFIIPYIIYNHHGTIKWEPIETLLMVLMVTIGSILYILIFLEQLTQKSKTGCIAMVYAGISNIFSICSLYICILIVKNTNISNIFTGVCRWMNFIYEKNPLSNSMKIAKQNSMVQQFMCVLAIFISILLVYIVAQVLMDDRGKIQLISKFLIEPLSIEWVRNCVITLQIPLIFYWIATIYKSAFGQWFENIQSMLQTIGCFGIGLLIAAMLIPIHKKSLKQVLAILIGLVLGMIPITILPFVVSLV